MMKLATLLLPLLAIVGLALGPGCNDDPPATYPTPSVPAVQVNVESSAPPTPAPAAEDPNGVRVGKDGDEVRVRGKVEGGSVDIDSDGNFEVQID